MRLDTRLDAKTKVDVPATQGRKAYSYYREGTAAEEKKSRRGKVGASIVSGALAIGGAALLAKKLNENKNSPSVLPPKSKEKELSLASKSKLSDSQKMGLKVAAGVTGSVAAYIGAREIQEARLKSDIVRQGNNIRDGVMTEDQVTSYLEKGLSKKDKANIREYIGYWEGTAKINGFARFSYSPSLIAGFNQILSDANYKKQDYLTITEAEWMKPYDKMVDIDKAQYGDRARSYGNGSTWRAEELEVFRDDRETLNTLSRTERIIKKAKGSKEDALLLEDLIRTQRDFLLHVNELSRALALKSLKRREEEIQSSRPTSDSSRLDTTCDRGKPCQGDDGQTYCIPQGATCGKGKVSRIVKSVAGAVGRGVITGLTAAAIAKLASKGEMGIKEDLNTGKKIFNAGRFTGKVESKVANGAKAIGELIKKRS